MSSVALLHLHRTEQRALLKALDQVLVEWKYTREKALPIPAQGPSALDPAIERGTGHLCYLAGVPQGNWTTVIQAFAEREDAPFLADLSNRLSQNLQTHSLAVLLHESEALYYNLDYRGTPRDGYCSVPQQVADHTLTEPEILQLRHMPKAFTPLLPKHIKMNQLFDVLNAGWWHAHDAKQLDETGDLIDERDLIDEADRLAAFGGLMQLNGSAGYPFAQWKTSKLIDWSRFTAVYYRAKGRLLPMV